MTKVYMKSRIHLFMNHVEEEVKYRSLEFLISNKATKARIFMSTTRYFSPNFTPLATCAILRQKNTVEKSLTKQGHLFVDVYVDSMWSLLAPTKNYVSFFILGGNSLLAILKIPRENFQGGRGLGFIKTRKVIERLEQDGVSIVPEGTSFGRIAVRLGG